MTSQPQTAADESIAELKRLGYRIRLVPGSAGVCLEAWKREVFLGPTTTLSVNRSTMDEAAAALLEYARGAK